MIIDNHSLPVNVNVAFVEKRMENVDRFDRGGPLLFIAKNQVNPFVKMLRDVIALQSRAVDADKFARVVLGPRRKNDVIKCHTALF